MSPEARFDEIYHYYQFITYLLAKEEFAYPSPNYGEFFTRKRVETAWRGTREAIDAGDAPSELSLYVHLPFCECGCLYCMSGSIQVSQRGPYLDDYLDSLEAEMSCYAGIMGDVPVQSAYIGGGTPSMLSSPQIERLLGALKSHYTVDRDSRVIFEACVRESTLLASPTPTSVSLAEIRRRPPEADAKIRGVGRRRAHRANSSREDRHGRGSRWARSIWRPAWR